MRDDEAHTGHEHTIGMEKVVEDLLVVVGKLLRDLGRIHEAAGTLSATNNS
jgi:hypothetical protein